MTTTATYKSQGKLVYNYVTAYSPSKNSTGTVRPNGQGLAVDDSRSITLVRMQALHQFCCDALSEQLGTIRVEMAAFEPGEFDGANPCLWTKTYEYDPQTDSLLISENGTPVYANDNGAICTDPSALCDTLYA